MAIVRAAVASYGIVLDDVLVKDIDMPGEVLRAIEDKAKAKSMMVNNIGGK